MVKTISKSTLSVPIWIDDIKSFSDFKMTRFSYFVAEADKPIDDWMLVLGKTGIPVIIYGLTVAICQPSTSKGRFESVDDLEGLFDLIEDKSALSIETPDLWLPNELLESKRSPKRGDVYRIGQRLFTTALRFRTGRTTEKEFREECTEARDKPKYSAKETRVFAKWNTMQIDLAKARYAAKKDQGSYMQYREDDKAIKG